LDRVDYGSVPFSIKYAEEVSSASGLDLGSPYILRKNRNSSEAAKLTTADIITDLACTENL
jgi:hypothetical protein